MNNNNKNSILPIYLQKYIIRILCQYINNNYSVINTILNYEGYRLIENETNKIVLTLSLVSKEWFKFISDNISVSVDMNFDSNIVKISKNQSKIIKMAATTEKITTDASIESPIAKITSIENLKFNIDEYNNYQNNNNNQNQNQNQNKIIKPNNITTLKLHFDHKLNLFYSKVNNNLEITYPIEFTCDRIKQLPNLKKLIIRNIESVKIRRSVLKLLVKINECGGSNDCIRGLQVELLEVYIDQDINEIVLNYLISNCSSIYSVIFGSCNNRSIISNVIKLWSKSIKQVHVVTNYSSPPFRELSGLSINEENEFQNSKYLEFINNNNNNNNNNNGVGNSADVYNHDYNEFQQNQKTLDNFNDLNISNNIKFDGINYLCNIEQYQLLNGAAKIQDIYYTLKSSPNLLSYSFTVCFYMLSFYLSHPDERINLEPCNCNGIIDKTQFSVKNQVILVQIYFKEISKLLASSSKLNNIRINNICFQDRSYLSPSFIQLFSQTISNIPNLQKLVFYDNENSNIISNILKSNKSIKNFNIMFPIGFNNDSYIQNIKILIKENDHIEKFTIRLLDSLNEIYLLNYIKKQ